MATAAPTKYLRRIAMFSWGVAVSLATWNIPTLGQELPASAKADRVIVH